MDIAKKTNENANVFAVSDFYLAAFLKAKNMKLINIERNNKRVSFVFEEREDREQLSRDFFNDAQVQVNSFIHAIQDLKSIIYSV